MVRNGLATFLSAHPDIELAGTAGSGQEALDFCAEHGPPDVVLMDLIMPEMDGITTTRHLLAAHPSAKVVALSSFNEGRLVREALEAQVSGYLLKTVSGEELAEVVRRVHTGQKAISPEVTHALDGNRGHTAEHRDFDLTRRERDVLDLLARGFSNTEIAEQLDVKPSTVKTHVSRIFSKIGVSSRVEAATLAVQHGLVDGTRPHGG